MYSSRTKNWFQTQLLFVRGCDCGLSDRNTSSLPGGVGLPERTGVVRSINPQKYKDMPSPSQLFALLILPEVRMGWPGFQKVKSRLRKATALQYFPDEKIMQFIEHLCFPSEVLIQGSLLEVDFLSSKGKHSLMMSNSLLWAHSKFSRNVSKYLAFLVNK